jgi:pimeloyl-ACP methyl ester carboxylesterase
MQAPRLWEKPPHILQRLNGKRTCSLSSHNMNKVHCIFAIDMRGLALAAGLLLSLNACASTAETDWQTRIGRYSLDDVKRELGHPESCIGLDDGGTACSWLRAKERESVEKLILTFSPNGKLATSNHVHF